MGLCTAAVHPTHTVSQARTGRAARSRDNIGVISPRRVSSAITTSAIPLRDRLPAIEAGATGRRESPEQHPRRERHHTRDRSQDDPALTRQLGAAGDHLAPAPSYIVDEQHGQTDAEDSETAVHDREHRPLQVALTTGTHVAVDQGLQEHSERQAEPAAAGGQAIDLAGHTAECA
jgi:hypothetical protein